MPVNWIKPDLKKMLPQYKLIKDVIAGEQEVKAAETIYLPMPNPHDKSVENRERYQAYLTRAVFYGVGERTLNGLVGAVFAQDPEIQAPANLTDTIDDATGENVSLVQLMKRTCRLVVGYGRAGLFTDYPQKGDKEGGEPTVADMERGDIRPTITAYEPDKIINWRTKKRGAKTVLCLVVLEEHYMVSDDGFEERREKQYRVLRLDENDVYIVDVYRASVNNKEAMSGFYLYETMSPTKHDGTHFDSIPFVFIGSENNDPSVDAAPMYAICSLNIGHYRNSADYEESCYITGQATPVLTGLTENWVTTVLKGEVQLGSRAAVALPEGGSASMLQMESNSAPYEAMKHKEQQMVNLGAKLVEVQTAFKTATEASYNQSAENSVLSTIAGNVRLGFVWALGWATDFTGDPDKIDVILGTDFNLTQISVEQQKFTLEAWQKEAITFSEMRTVFRKSGMATQEDDAARNEIDSDAARMGAGQTGANDNTGNDVTDDDEFADDREVTNE